MTTLPRTAAVQTGSGVAGDGLVGGGDEVGPVLIGRDDILVRARQALTRRGVVICGTAGSGRTSLARALAPDSVWVLATESTATVPLWAARGLLPPIAGGSEGGPARASTSNHEVSARSPVSSSDLERVEAALRLHLARQRRPLVAVVDDLDHLDSASSSVILRLVTDGQVRLIGLRKSSRPAPEDVSVLWREAGLDRIDLPPLNADDSAAVVTNVIGGPVDGRTLKYLVDLAAGNPFLASELVRGSIGAGTLQERHGLWTLTGEAGLTPEIADRAKIELDCLPADLRSAAEVLAMAGAIPIGMALVLPGAIPLEALERLGLAEIFGQGDQAKARLASPVLALHLCTTLPTASRIRMAAELADAARISGAAEPGGPLELAAIEWDLTAHRRGDAKRLLAGARMALDQGDPSRAERLARASAAVESSTEAILLESWCADERGDPVAASETLARHVPDSDEALVAVTIRRAEQAFWTHHDAQAAYALLDSAQTAAKPWPLALDAEKAVFQVLEGRIDMSLAMSLPLVDHPEPLVASAASLAAALSLAMTDRADEAADMANRAMEALSAPSPSLYLDPGVHVISLGWSLLNAGRLIDADELTSAIYQHTLTRPGRQAQGWAALLRSRVLLARGRPAEARTVALEAEQIWASAQMAGLARWCTTAAALASASMGDRAALAHDLSRLESHPCGPFGLFEPEVDRARAWQLNLSGRHDEARVMLKDLATSASASGRHAQAAEMAHDLVRMGAPSAAVPILQAIPVRSRLSQVRLALAHGLVHSPGDLDILADDLDAIGATGWGLEVRCLAALATPNRVHKVRAQAIAATEQTGLATPPLVSLEKAANADGLTPREQEVVALVCNGLSNREVAEALVVSVRTVENHLHRAYTKMGVSSRTDLVP